ncbi:MAG: VOC family protein [Deltaproteobacteria bacterium]
MTVELNHTIVWCRSPEKSSSFLVEVLGLALPTRLGPFHVVQVSNGVSLDFHSTGAEIAPQHYAFLVGEADFDAIFARLRERALDYWADPAQRLQGEINRNDGGRGAYFQDPDGHLLEIITRPYGSGS